MPRKKKPESAPLGPAKKIRRSPQPHNSYRRSTIDRRSRLMPLLSQSDSTHQDQFVLSASTTVNQHYIQHAKAGHEESPLFIADQIAIDETAQHPVVDAETPTNGWRNEILDLGLPTQSCQYCGAMFWKQEALQQTSKNSVPIYPLCCKHGEVDLPLLNSTPPLLDELLDVNGGPRSKHYRNHIRSYNAAFSWTSFGAKFDPKLVNSRGPYSLVLCGENLHYMGSLLPERGKRPRYSQLYIFDPATEISDRYVNVSGAERKLDQTLIQELQKMLDQHNVLARSYRQVRVALKLPANHDLRLRISGARVPRDRRYELPTGTDLAGLIPGDFEPNKDDRDIIVNNKSTGLTRITSLHPLFDSLHFPMLFPHGNDGFHTKILYHPQRVNPSKRREWVTQNEYYAFRVQYRPNEGTTLIRSGKALQHYCIDAFTTVEQNRLNYIKLNQDKLRADLYKGLQDALHRGDLDSRNVGNVICPSSFTGGVRYMQQLYLDAIAICQFYGSPDLFITFTCNAQWPEIVNAFADVVGTHAEDKPMIVDRVFKMKLANLKEDLMKRKFFGRTVASMHSVEFQKRGLPHVHIIIWLQNEDKPLTMDKVDQIISAELPDPQVDPIGYEAVSKFMIHGPCGTTRPSSPCMRENKCSKLFPKPYCSETTFDDNGFITYRRRHTNISALKGGQSFGNAFVVPHNRDLLVRYEAHINIEICHKGQLIKYLFKYITKGPDRSTIFPENQTTQSNTPTSHLSEPINEVGRYLDCRSISSYESIWRLFQYKLHERSVPVVRLCVHRPGGHMVTFPESTSVGSILNRPGVEKTMLTEWFTLNRTSVSARKFTYSNLPNGFIWDKKGKQWRPRKRGYAIGRICSVPPKSGDVFYLRILLTKIKGAIGFQHLRTINGVVYDSFQETCQALGLLSTDEEWNAVMSEVCQWGMAPLIRSTFISLLLFCEVASPSNLFEQWWISMADDFKRTLQKSHGNPMQGVDQSILRNEVLHSLQMQLHRQSSSLAHFNLPHPTPHITPLDVEDLITEQLQYDQEKEARLYCEQVRTLNRSQKRAHDQVMASVDKNDGKLFFLYGHGGTGKTYLYNCIVSKLRSRHQIVLVVASSGIAATLLPGGVTAHSRFKIPIDIDHRSTCAIKKGTKLALLIEATTLIVWDEAPMVHRLSFEALDRTLCDIMSKPTDGPNYVPFGGKTVLLGGDFRQTLPVVTNGGREDNLNASFTRSYLWGYCTLIELTTNMRITDLNSQESPAYEGMRFPDWVLALGNGQLRKRSLAGYAIKDSITIPAKFLMPPSTNPIATLVDKVYPSLLTSYKSVQYIRSRTIVTPTNKIVTQINDFVLGCLPGDEKIYLSSDTLTTFGNNQNQMELQYPTEFLNSLSLNGMPEHELRFKPYTVVMLLRNINPSAGLCNGTRILLTHLANNVIRGLIIGGSYEGNVAIIPRVVLDKADPNWPFTLKRRQYPVRLCYAMTINKSQGQTLDEVGLYLPTPVFSHGQLYVAVSRVRSADGIHIVVENGVGDPADITRNIVYDEIFQDLDNHLTNRIS